MVKVDKFIFPIDYIMLDMEEDEETLVILGRPFLATSKVLIDVLKGKIIMRVEDEEIAFEILKSMNFPPKVQYCDKLDDFTSKSSMAKPLRTNTLVIATN